MSSKTVRCDVVDGVAQVRLNRPDKHNGISLDMLKEVVATAAQLKKDKSLRAVVLAGDGPSFCAGLDFQSVLGKKTDAVRAYAELYKPYANIFQRWSLAWREIGVPVIACIHGNCFGGGIQLALGADIRIASPDAKLSVLEAKWGLVPDMGGVVTLRELIPLDVAKELVMTGRIFSGEEAKALGLVTHIAEDPFAKADAIIAEMRTRSPDSVAASKFLLQEAWREDDDTASAKERRWQRALLGGQNNRISIERNMKKSDKAFVPRKYG